MYEVTDKMLELEKEYKLNSIEIDGFHPWTYARVLIFQYFHLTQRTIPVSLKEILSTCFSNSLSIMRMLFRKTRLNISEVDILLTTIGRRYLADGVYEDYITDCVASAFDKSVTLEHPNRFDHFAPAKTKNLIYSDKIMLKSYIKSLAQRFLRTKKYKYINNKVIQSFILPLDKLFGGVNADTCRWVDWMTLQYFVYKSQYDDYASILKRMSPKVIVENCHPRMDNMIINEIAKKMKIPTIELQHGVFYTISPDYCYNQDEKIPQFPDMMFIYSDYMRKYCAKAPIANDKIFSVGYPYFERQLKCFKNTAKQISDKKTIVFLSQPMKANINFDKLAVDFNNAMKSKDWKVVFKLHPMEYDNWRAHYPALLNTSIEVVDSPAKKTLHEIFAESSALIGISSTAIYEGIGFGLAAFIYNVPGSEHIQDLCKEGFAVNISNCEELCNAVNSLKENFVSRCHELFKPNAIENMKEIIMPMLREKNGNE